MPIDTEILGRFTTLKGFEMVSFAAIRETDGRNWAAPLGLVSRYLGPEVQVGLAVRIETDGDRIVRVQRHRHPPTSVTTQAPSPAIPSPGRARPQPAPAGGQQSASPTRLPYGFVPINPDRAVQDTPVWHDGSGGGELLSGEILCELEALTPLLPGNQRYKVEDVRSQDLQQWGCGDVAQQKQIAEPLRLPDGRVVIAGSALKGMIRHSLGALLSAPMERVSEHHFTYRPNLGHPGAAARLECRPAVITAVTDDRIDVKVLPAQAAIFVHCASALRALGGYQPGSLVTSTLTKSYLDTDLKTNQRRIRSHTTNSLALKHYLYSYTGGIDGTGGLASAFADGRRQVHQEALVPAADVGAAIHKTISEDILQQYRLTQKILADAKSGHLTNAHPLTKNLGQAGVERAQRDIGQTTQLRVNQLIYVEIEVFSMELGEIQSFGHNYQYRWAYTSSVRTKAGRPRVCLHPGDCERAIESNEERQDSSPRSLTGARLLFGYVRDDETNLIGKGVFERLAGRIAFNHALSEGVPEFLGDPNHGNCVPLRILGQPKPSAWEFYLQQPQNGTMPLVTYGDLPHDAGGELAGRKFYQHQPGVSLEDIKARDQKEINSDQATLARFICPAGTMFRFAIRFMSLRAWELAALLAALEPHRLKPGTKPEDYAHKLGLGRPLGMGSVRIAPQEIRVRLDKDVTFLGKEDSEKWLGDRLNELNQKLNSDIVKDWLAVHEYQKQGKLGFPVGWTKVDGQQVQTIYAWHTLLHRDFSKFRRQQEVSWSELSRKIREAKG